MYQIFIHKTQINDKCKIDAYLFNNGEKDMIIYGLTIPSDKIDLIDTFIELSNVGSDIHKDVYNFIKNELEIIVENGELSKLKNNITNLQNDLETLKKSESESETINLNNIVNFLKSIDIQYYINNDNLYKSNSKVVIPKILCLYFDKATKDNDVKYAKSLNLFWTNCLMKENYSNIENLFEFIYNNGLTITPNGYLFAFRRIVTKNSPEDVRLFEFILQVWLDNIKRSVSNDKVYIGYDNVINEYFYTESNTYIPEDLKILGTVSELYEKLKNSDFTVKYTDNHTKTFNYKIGHTYIVNNVDPDPDHACSYGLHLGSKSYVKNNSWLGDTIVGCLVNPRDIIAVADNYEKLRVRKMFIACIIPENEIDSFNYSLYNYDFEDIKIKEDNLEFVDYTFSESYKKVSKHELEINRLVSEIRDFENQVKLFCNDTDMDILEIINVLNQNYNEISKTN